MRRERCARAWDPVMGGAVGPGGANFALTAEFPACRTSGAGGRDTILSDKTADT